MKRGAAGVILCTTVATFLLAFAGVVLHGTGSEWIPIEPDDRAVAIIGLVCPAANAFGLLPTELQRSTFELEDMRIHCPQTADDQPTIELRRSP